jgi:hypothetical protein
MLNEKSGIRIEDYIRFGWISSLIVGILYILVGGTHFLLPPDQLRGGRGIDEAFFLSLADLSLVFSVHYWLVVLLSFFSLAVILTFFKIVSSAHEGIVLWVTVIGIIGAGLSIVDFASVGVNAPRIAQHFSSYNESQKLAALITGVPHADPCFLAWAFAGIWGLGCNGLALQHKLLPKAVCYVGILGSILQFFVFLGSVNQKQMIVDIAVGVGGLVIAPVWYIWFGLAIKKIYGRAAHYE